MLSDLESTGGGMIEEESGEEETPQEDMAVDPVAGPVAGPSHLA
jgi:hypothetical protein